MSGELSLQDRVSDDGGKCAWEISSVFGYTIGMSLAWGEENFNWAYVEKMPRDRFKADDKEVVLQKAFAIVLASHLNDASSELTDCNGSIKPEQGQ